MQLKKYKNITTGRVVTAIEVFESNTFGRLTIKYIREIDLEEFLKPLYVFEKTYVLN